VGKRNFQEFLSNYIDEKPGDIIDIDTNKVVEQHKGAIFYTIGQRRGLDIGGSEKPYFVVNKNIKDNIVYVAMGEEHPLLNKDEVTAYDISLLVDESNFKTNKMYVKLRHSNIKYKAKVLNMEQQDNGLYKIDFKLGEKVFAITPGQELVMYREGICLGGGKIK
jgi:tRNA-specific 2-thiouridylase